MASIFEDGAMRADGPQESALAKELAGAYSEATVPQEALEYEGIYDELYESHASSAGKAISRTVRHPSSASPPARSAASCQAHTLPPLPLLILRAGAGGEEFHLCHANLRRDSLPPLLARVHEAQAQI